LSRLHRAIPVALALAAVLAAGALAQDPPRETRIVDGKKDANSGVFDIAGVRFGVGGDGRLRAIVTMAGEWENAALLAGEAGGPPGSVCLRLFTKADPTAAPPDHLLCVTAGVAEGGGGTGETGATLRGELLRQEPGEEPTSVKATIAVSRPTKRSVTIRVAQTAVGRPARIRFVVEATRAGCPRTSCTDRAPDAPRTATLRLRAPSASAGAGAASR
jgi:hypothetical protein